MHQHAATILLLSIILWLRAPDATAATGLYEQQSQQQQKQRQEVASPQNVEEKGNSNKKKNDHECERRIIVGFAKSGRGRSLRNGDVIDSDIQLPGGVRFFATRRRQQDEDVATEKGQLHHVLRKDARIFTTNFIAATTAATGGKDENEITSTKKNVLIIHESTTSAKEKGTASILPWKKNRKLASSQDRRATAMAQDGGEIVAIFPRPVQIRSLSLLKTPEAGSVLVQLYGEFGTVLQEFLVSDADLRSASSDDDGNNDDASLGFYKLILPESSPRDIIRVVVSLESYGALGSIQFDRPCGHSPIRAASHVHTMSLEDRLRHKQHLESRDRRVSGPWPECVGQTVEACRAMIEHHAKDVVGRVKAAHPRSFSFYRIWIMVNEDGIVAGVPRRG